MIMIARLFGLFYCPQWSQRRVATAAVYIYVHVIKTNFNHRILQHSLWILIRASQVVNLSPAAGVFFCFNCNKLHFFVTFPPNCKSVMQEKWNHNLTSTCIKTVQKRITVSVSVCYIKMHPAHSSFYIMYPKQFWGNVYIMNSRVKSCFVFVVPFPLWFLHC